jgi:tetratricopeptide (TPR) repeat protein
VPATRIFIVTLLLQWAATTTAHPGLDVALARLDGMIDANPRVQALYIRRGALLSNHGDFARALADLERAETLGDADAVAFDRGVLAYRMGNHVAARRHLGRYLAQHPQHAEALMWRARAAREDGDSSAALADFRRYFDVAKAPAPGEWLSAARLLAQRGNTGADAALALLDEALLRCGMVPQLQRYAVELELQRAATANAERRWLTLRDAFGDSPEWKVRMAELHMRVDHRHQAAQLLRQADQQLRRLKKTPARQQLRKHIAMLTARLAEPLPAGQRTLPLT